MYHQKQQPTSQLLEKKSCYFCKSNVKYIDFKEVDFIRKFVSMQAKVKPQRRTKCCAKHQRELATAIKRARFMSLLPYIGL